MPLASRRPSLAVQIHPLDPNDTSTQGSASPSSFTSFPPPMSSTNDLVQDKDQDKPAIYAPDHKQYVAPQPSVRLLFSFTTKADIPLLASAILVALCAAAIPPFMTILIGQIFNAFSRFPLTPNPSEQDKSALLQDVGMSAIQLAALSGGTFLINAAISALWIWFGERHVLRLRRTVYDAVSNRNLEWFDLGAGAQPGVKDETVGAGGLMAKFARDSDDVRLATALNMGMLIQLSATTIATFVLAMQRSATLTLVIISSVPLMLIVQGITQTLAFKHLMAERSNGASASTIVEKAVTAIATVKAFNAQNYEHQRASKHFDGMRDHDHKAANLWSLSTSASGFITFSMFVQGFWYGSKLVREGKISPGDVLSVFWCCLIASSSLQLMVPLTVVHARGTSAMVSLMTIINPPPAPPRPTQRPRSNHIPITTKVPRSPFKLTRKSSQLRRSSLRKIKPTNCRGGFDLRNVTFSYPSRPEVPILEDISMYLPEGETTFIVGGSGSGKSSIASLLLRLYEPDSGEILMDDQLFPYLDEKWTRSHIAAVSQGCILFDLSVHDNVAMGLAGGNGTRKPKDATREEVIQACTTALIHDFVRDLPDGYDTLLGEGGTNLSGGQKQRLAIARAYMRDPTVLILDEATSALDGTSRLLVFEAIKAWRKNRTTIVITHDLSQIGSEDFVYVLNQGRIVEQGFREALEENVNGTFSKMLATQGLTGGFLPTKDVAADEQIQLAERAAAIEETEAQLEKRDLNGRRKHMSTLGSFALVPPDPSIMEVAFGNLRQSIRPSMLPPRRPSLPMFPEDVEPSDVRGPKKRRSSLTIVTQSTKAENDFAWKRSSLQFTPTSPFTFQFPQNSNPNASNNNYNISDYNRESAFSHPDSIDPIQVIAEEEEGDEEDEDQIEDDESFEEEKNAMKMTAAEVSNRRRKTSTRRKWDNNPSVSTMVEITGRQPRKLTSIRSLRSYRSKNQLAQRQQQQQQQQQQPNTLAPIPSKSEAPIQEEESRPMLTVGQLIKAIWPYVPTKSLFFLAVICAILNGAATPVFAYLLARLVAAVTTGSHDTSLVNKYAIIVFFIAVANGISAGLLYYFAENTAMRWVQAVRKKAFALVLAQDKSWFDKGKRNTAPMIVQSVMKDSEDARKWVTIIMPQGVVVTTMLGLGLIWALVRGWQLTLIGLGLGPIFGISMALQSSWAAKVELRNKRCREETNKRYYDAVNNVKAIRSMGLEGVFKEMFEESLNKTKGAGIRGAGIDGLGYGIANALIYLSQALLFYVGAVFIANGTYSYLRMIEVLNLVVFSVTIGGQLLAFVQRIATTIVSTRDIERLLSLDTKSDESRGSAKFPVQGEIAFHSVNFSYPSRPEASILKNMSFHIHPTECVAIVGASGSGKSTIAALLQRLYEPTSGVITIGGQLLGDCDTTWLRDHLAVVSQHPHLFDASVEDNIAYGVAGATRADVERAAREANVHDFIMTLPQGYDTSLGENASLVSGGQAQRIQIARALVRSTVASRYSRWSGSTFTSLSPNANAGGSILILDECTSALDPANQKAVMSTIAKVKNGRTTVIVSHKLPVMQMADRIMVVEDGGVVEEGKYEELMRRRGVFFRLASAGEWEGE